MGNSDTGPCMDSPGRGSAAGATAGRSWGVTRRNCAAPRGVRGRAAHPGGRRRRREDPCGGVARARGGRRRGGTTDRWLAPPSFWPACALRCAAVHRRPWEGQENFLFAQSSRQPHETPLRCYCRGVSCGRLELCPHSSAHSAMPRASLPRPSLALAHAGAPLRAPVRSFSAAK